MPLVACFAGKAKWVTDFVPERGRWALQDLIICNSKDKSFLARPGHILIDDRASNIKEWTEAGGTGILHEGNFALTLQKTRAAAGAPVKKSSPVHRPLAP